MKAQYITDQIEILFSRLSPPRSISKNAEAQGQEIAQVVQIIAKAAPSQNIAEWWQGFEMRLLEAHETRAWPTIAEIKRALGGSGKGVDPERVFMAQLQSAILWFDAKKKPHPVFNNSRITEAMLRGGQLSDLRFARWKGFSLTKEQMAEAKKMRMGWAEWKQHVEICANLRGISVGEADTQERADIGHMAPA